MRKIHKNLHNFANLRDRYIKIHRYTYSWYERRIDPDGRVRLVWNVSCMRKIKRYILLLAFNTQYSLC